MIKIFFFTCLILLCDEIQAQSDNIYTVSQFSPFTIKKDGKKIGLPAVQKTTKEKTKFIFLDCNLNIYSYTINTRGAGKIFRNGTIIKSFQSRPGLNILSADSLGNWWGFVNKRKSEADIYSNNKLIKSVKLDSTRSEKIIGIEKNGIVYSSITDRANSIISVRKNAETIINKTLPKHTVGYTVVRRSARISNEEAAYLFYFWVRPVYPSRNPICPKGSAMDYSCLLANGCVDISGNIDEYCARDKNTRGICPCIQSSDGTPDTEIPVSPDCRNTP